MQPTLKQNSFHLIGLFNYKINYPKLNDIVAIRLSGKKIIHLSRIIAMPGKKIEIKNGVFYINDQRQDTLFHNLVFYKKIRLSKDEYFIAGDFLTKKQSPKNIRHILGRVKLDRIIGKVLF